MVSIQTTQELGEALGSGSIGQVEFPANVNLLWFDQAPGDQAARGFEELGRVDGRSVHLR